MIYKHDFNSRWCTKNRNKTHIKSFFCFHFIDLFLDKNSHWMIISGRPVSNDYIEKIDWNEDFRQVYQNKEWYVLNGVGSLGYYKQRNLPVRRHQQIFLRILYLHWISYSTLIIKNNLKPHLPSPPWGWYGNTVRYEPSSGITWEIRKCPPTPKG